MDKGHSLWLTAVHFWLKRMLHKWSGAHNCRPPPPFCFIDTIQHRQVNIRWLHALYCLSVTSTFSLVAVPTMTSSSSPLSYSIHPFFSHFTATLLLTLRLHPRPAILLSPSPLPSPPLARSIILASHSEQKQHQSNWFCCCAEEPHQLTDWVSRLPSPSGPLYFCLSFSLSVSLSLAVASTFSLSSQCLLSMPSVSQLSSIPFSHHARSLPFLWYITPGPISV